MVAATTLNEFLDALYRRRSQGIKLGLDTTRALLDTMGNPHHDMACIHVAGTNGKGSVCAMLDSILRAAGMHSGLYTSPHLVRFHERIQVDGEAIADDPLYDLFREVDARATEIAKQPGVRQPTFFEFITVAALTCFHRRKVQVAVVETGLGGRLDATNVVDPVLTAITSLGVDHVSFLGGRLEGIAREKAGIIKGGCPVVLGAMDEASLAQVLEVARQRRAPVIRVDEHVSIRRGRQDLHGQKLSIETGATSYAPVRLPLLGEHQVANAAIAVTAAEQLGAFPEWTLADAHIRKGLESVVWPARGQVLAQDPLVLLDAAHNPSGARALRALCDDLAGDIPLGLIVGFARDKRPEEFFNHFAARRPAGWVVPLDTPRGRPPADVVSLAKTAGITAVERSLDAAVEEAMAWASRVQGAVCIAGSIYLAGEVLRRRGELGLP